LPGESCSDLLDRLLNEQRGVTGPEWLELLAPLEGRGIYTPLEREWLKADQRTPRRSSARREALG